MFVNRAALLCAVGAIAAPRGSNESLMKRSPPAKASGGIPLTGLQVAYPQSKYHKRQNLYQLAHQHWFADMTLGNQGTTYTCLVDTGSPDFLIFNNAVDTSDTSITPNGQQCTQTYGGGASSTAGDIYSGPYSIADLGTFSGYFCLAPPPNDNPEAQNGILGLSWPKPAGQGNDVSAQTGNNPLLATGWNGFGLYLSSQSQGGNGQLTPSGADPDYYQSEDLWTYEDVIQDPSQAGQPSYPGYWQFSYTAWSVNGQSGAPAKPLAFIDSGNPFINLDSQTAATVWAQIGPDVTASAPKTPPVVDCSYMGTAPPVSFTGGSGAVYTIPSNIYVKNRPDGSCFVAITYVADDSRANVFGTPFVQTYYTYFDKEAVLLSFNPSVG